MPSRSLFAVCAAALALIGCAATTTSSQSSAAASHTTKAASVHHARRARRAHRTPTASDGALSLITEPHDGITPVLTAVQRARRQVDMVMYEDSDTQVNAALAAAVHRGVRVRVLLNGGYYGQGSPQNQAAYTYLKGQGVPVRFTPHAFALTHQKTLVVDGRAYILTFNLTPQYYATSRDFGIIDTRPADDAAIQRTFDADWADQRIDPPAGADLVWSPGSEAALVYLLSKATGRLDIYNEEMDSTAVEQALEADARRGVDVRVTMTADSSWDSAFAALAAAGVHVRTYPADASLYIHAKMILTPARAFVGSENFSTVSMNDNRELGLITNDAPIRTSLARTFDDDYAHATPYSHRRHDPGGGAGGRSPSCSVSASHSSRYDDWDVYVRSGEGDTTATVSDSAGTTASYHTDSDGYADIYLKAPASAAGQTITVHVGQATCSGTL